jgi:hypothetical protein
MVEHGRDMVAKRGMEASSDSAGIDLVRVARTNATTELGPLGIHEIEHLWDDEDISLSDKEEYNKAESELYLSHRVLIHAVEGYLLGCVEYPVLTAEAALRRTTGTDSLIDLLQAEEDSMIHNFGPPWVERTLTFGESSPDALQPPETANIPKRGAAPSGATAPWRWFWR